MKICFMPVRIFLLWKMWRCCLNVFVHRCKEWIGLEAREHVLGSNTSRLKDLVLPSPQTSPSLLSSLLLKHVFLVHLLCNVS